MSQKKSKTQRRSLPWGQARGVMAELLVMCDQFLIVLAELSRTSTVFFDGAPDPARSFVNERSDRSVA